MNSASPEMRCERTRSSGNCEPQYCPQLPAERPPVERTLWQAPTVSAFLATAGASREPYSTHPISALGVLSCALAARPRLPAAITTSMSRCFQTNSSICSAWAS